MSATAWNISQRLKRCMCVDGRLAARHPRSRAAARVLWRLRLRKHPVHSRSSCAPQRRRCCTRVTPGFEASLKPAVSCHLRAWMGACCRPGASPMRAARWGGGAHSSSARCEMASVKPWRIMRHRGASKAPRAHLQCSCTCLPKDQCTSSHQGGISAMQRCAIARASLCLLHCR